MAQTKNETIESYINFEIEPSSELMPIETNADFDLEKIENINAKLDAGNKWIWCTIRVKAEFKGIIGESFLAECSYENENEFKNSEFWPKMRDEAFENLKKNVEKLKYRIYEFEKLLAKVG